jgi:hypothetical protein
MIDNEGSALLASDGKRWQTVPRQSWTLNQSLRKSCIQPAKTSSGVQSYYLLRSVWYRQNELRRVIRIELNQLVVRIKTLEVDITDSRKN